LRDNLLLQESPVNRFNQITFRQRTKTISRLRAQEAACFNPLLIEAPVSEKQPLAFSHWLLA